MAAITFRPDFRTSGGEVTELLLDGRYVGTMTLVYREGGRLSGSVQLDRHSLSGQRQEAALDAARQYVRQLADALAAKHCEVIFTCSAFDQIMATGDPTGDMESFEEGDAEARFGPHRIEIDDDDDYELGDVEPDGRDTLEMSDDEMADDEMADDEAESEDCELVIVGESRNRVEYHVYGRGREWLAEAMIHIRGDDVVGDVFWNVMPTDDEVRQTADLLVSDFDPDEVSAFTFDMTYNGDVFETIELTHEDLLDDEPAGDEEREAVDDDYSVVLIRDDGDTLTYDLYEHSRGGLPIGQATVDISSRELTGFIDFREPSDSLDRERIGMLLMRELDKEKDYRSLHLTMLVNNEPIDEIMFEPETVH